MIRSSVAGLFPAALALGAVAFACTGRYGYTNADPARGWPATLVVAESLATAGQYASADSVLAAFGADNDGNAAGTESLYWRALFKLDPSNLGASPADALQALDAYAQAPHSEPHLAEVQVLRRTAVLVGSIERLAEQAASQTDSVSAADSAAKRARAAGDIRAKSKDEEIVRLRTELEKALAELAQTNQELDRIKKRLVAPKSDTDPTPP